MKVYEKVRNYIDNNGLKQVSVARKAGISKVTFNAILNGKRTCMLMTCGQSALP